MWCTRKSGAWRRRTNRQVRPKDPWFGRSIAMCGSVSTPSVGLGQPDTELPLRLGHWASYFVPTYPAAINPSSPCRAAFSILHRWPQHHLSNKVITLGSQPLRASVSHLWNETGLSIIPFLPVPVFYCCCGKWPWGLKQYKFIILLCCRSEV